MITVIFVLCAVNSAPKKRLRCLPSPSAGFAVGDATSLLAALHDDVFVVPACAAAHGGRRRQEEAQGAGHHPAGAQGLRLARPAPRNQRLLASPSIRTNMALNIPLKKTNFMDCCHFSQ
uniref:Secreted protein n=1 Tax=Steinernema glaseri TaxID=37863 RepID=A0A1I8A1Y6_9BILA